KMNTQFTAV
nr:Chain C, Nonapeptide from Influenza A virus HA protein [H1N1 swine influenza virus]5H94_F Chain F, Nonapeptide from Influenza A virus HA protein [H1N1 swine influenza virus]